MGKLIYNFILWILFQKYISHIWDKFKISLGIFAKLYTSMFVHVFNYTQVFPIHSNKNTLQIEYMEDWWNLIQT